MQPPYSCVPGTFSAIEGSLSPARLGRYLNAAGGDKHLALRLYVWNARMGEAFYLPSQIAEVCIRNAIHKALCSKHGPQWFNLAAFRCTLPNRLRDELDKVIDSERGAYGAGMTADHIVSGLTFGFWSHLL